jgi:tetratricopeptide (TPR) repeat protein
MNHSLHKTAILFFMLVFVASLGSSARQSNLPNPQLAFNEANEQYKQGHIHKALSAYHQLEQQNQISGALFVNMGMSYIRLDSLGKAEYYFLKARQFDETKKTADKGINYVQKNLSHQSAVLPTLPWQRAFTWMKNNIGVVGLLALGLILINLSVALYILPWFVRRFRRIFVNVAIVAVFIGILAIFSSFYINYRTHRYHKAVMIVQKADVIQKPQSNSTVVNTAYNGYIFTVDRKKSGKHSGWNYIQMSNGQHGWIQSDKIMIL